jgi:hypothetical protein
MRQQARDGPYWTTIWSLFCRDDEPCVHRWTLGRILVWAGWAAVGLAVSLFVRHVARRERGEGRSLNSISWPALIGAVGGIALGVVGWIVPAVLAVDV